MPIYQEPSRAFQLTALDANTVTYYNTHAHRFNGFQQHPNVFNRSFVFTQRVLHEAPERYVAFRDHLANAGRTQQSQTLDQYRQALLQILEGYPHLIQELGEIAPQLVDHTIGGPPKTVAEGVARRQRHDDRTLASAAQPMLGCGMENSTVDPSILANGNGSSSYMQLPFLPYSEPRALCEDTPPPPYLPGDHRAGLLAPTQQNHVDGQLGQQYQANDNSLVYDVPTPRTVASSGRDYERQWNRYQFDQNGVNPYNDSTEPVYDAPTPQDFPQDESELQEPMPDADMGGGETTDMTLEELRHAPQSTPCNGKAVDVPVEGMAQAADRPAYIPQHRYIHAVCSHAYTEKSTVKKHHKTCIKKNPSDLSWDAHTSCHMEHVHFHCGRTFSEVRAVWRHHPHCPKLKDHPNCEWDAHASCQFTPKSKFINRVDAETITDDIDNDIDHNVDNDDEYIEEKKPGNNALQANPPVPKSTPPKKNHGKDRPSRCERCVKHKKGCNRERPSCSTCIAVGHACVYEEDASRPPTPEQESPKLKLTIPKSIRNRAKPVSTPSTGIKAASEASAIATSSKEVKTTSSVVAPALPGKTVASLATVTPKRANILCKRCKARGATKACDSGWPICRKCLQDGVKCKYPDDVELTDITTVLGEEHNVNRDAATTEIDAVVEDEIKASDEDTTGLTGIDTTQMFTNYDGFIVIEERASEETDIVDKSTALQGRLVLDPLSSQSLEAPSIHSAGHNVHTKDTATTDPPTTPHALIERSAPHLDPLLSNIVVDVPSVPNTDAGAQGGHTGYTTPVISHAVYTATNSSDLSEAPENLLSPQNSPLSSYPPNPQSLTAIEHNSAIVKEPPNTTETESSPLTSVPDNLSSPADTNPVTKLAAAPKTPMKESPVAAHTRSHPPPDSPSSPQLPRCLRCKQMQKKCDRQQPCNECKRKRGPIPHECIYPEPKPASRNPPRGSHPLGKRELDLLKAEPRVRERKRKSTAEPVEEGRTELKMTKRAKKDEPKSAKSAKSTNKDEPKGTKSTEKGSTKAQK